MLIKFNPVMLMLILIMAAMARGLADGDADAADTHADIVMMNMMVMTAVR